MRILVVNPVGHSKWDEQDKRIYESFASTGTEIDVVSLPSGPPTVEGPEELAEATYMVVKLVKKRHTDYDAIIVNCFLDPGVDLLKGILDKPVVGPGESSLALASLAGRRIAIITVGNEALWLIERRISMLGYKDKVTSVRGIPMGVMDLDKDPELTKHHLLEEASKAISGEGADVVVLGCTGLAGLAQELQQSLKVPVIDPAGAALSVAESMVRLGLAGGVNE